MITWMTARLGSAVAKWVFIAVIVLVALICVAILWRCTSPKTDKAVEVQARQGNASGEALSDAAAVAVDTVVTRNATEHDLDVATGVALEEIDHAQDPASVRAAVQRNLCMRPAHRNDPACRVR
jgi:hypothetical protein